MKKENLIMRICLFIVCLSFMAACANQPTKIRDEEHKSFYVNGISALDGYEAVSNSLKDIGFTIDKDLDKLDEKDDVKDGVSINDFRIIGEGYYYSASYDAERLTNEQLSKLTYGLFDNLPSGIYSNGNYGCRVTLEWYPFGEIKRYFIYFYKLNSEVDLNYIDNPLRNKDVTEVNKRLSVLFPHSKIRNSYCDDRIYYDDNGVEARFKSFELEVEKKEIEIPSSIKK